MNKRGNGGNDGTIHSSTIYSFDYTVYSLSGKIESLKKTFRRDAVNLYAIDRRTECSANTLGGVAVARKRSSNIHGAVAVQWSLVWSLAMRQP